MSNITEALNATWSHLWWLTDDDAKPNRYRIALDLFTDPIIRQRANERMADRITKGRGDRETADRRAIGGHSDPTASAAIGDAADELLRQEHAEMVGLERTIATAAGELRQMTQRALYDVSTDLGSLTLRQAASEVVWCCTAPHTASEAHHTLRLVDRTEEANELAHAADFIYRKTHQLQGLVLSHLERAVRPVSDKPRQKPLRRCVVHQEHGFIEVLADSTRRKDRCTKCADFRANHQCDPTYEILRGWEYAQGPRPGQIIEAKAKSNNKRGTA